MAIENRNLAVWTKLTGKYRKVIYKAEVVQTEEGIRYRLEDGRGFKSLSAAGMAITGGPINGWSFWGVETEGSETEIQPPKATKAKKANGVIRKTQNQKGAPEGQVRFFCSACLDSFYAEAGETPAACPKGHDETFGTIKSDFEEPATTAEEVDGSIAE